jgi:oligosaccharide repeat unit polymerase
MHWLFFLIFFSLIPLIQYTTGQFPLWLDKEEAYPILLTNLLLITWIGFYVVGYYIRKPHNKKTSFTEERLRIGKRGVFISVYLSFLVLIIFLYVFGLRNMLIRGAYREVLYTIHPHHLMMFLDKFLKVIPVLSLIGLLIMRGRWKNKKQWWFLTSSLVLINLLVNNPFACSRYWAGTVILGFIVFLFIGKRKKRGWVLLILLLGILILYPLSNGFRDKALKTIKVEQFNVNKLPMLYTSPNFDAYEMAVHTVQYRKRTGMTYGRQLSGPLLFWIPRSLWKGKPVGSGRVIARFFSIPYENLCCPLPFEGYINFGVCGLILFAFGFGWILSSLDDYYWKTFGLMFPNILSVYYPFLLGFVFFMMRGDLISSFSYTAMFIIAGLQLLIK